MFNVNHLFQTYLYNKIPVPKVVSLSFGSVASHLGTLLKVKPRIHVKSVVTAHTTARKSVPTTTIYCVGLKAAVQSGQMGLSRQTTRTIPTVWIFHATRSGNTGHAGEQKFILDHVISDHLHPAGPVGVIRKVTIKDTEIMLEKCKFLLQINPKTSKTITLI